jgi:hypothetical protein
MRYLLIIASLACATGEWHSPVAQRPAQPFELASTRVTVDGPPEMAAAMARAGFPVVQHPPFRSDLLLVYRDGVGTLRSDGFFVDEARGDPDAVAQQLARSARVAEFIRNSGMPDQRASPGM